MNNLLKSTIKALLTAIITAAVLVFILAFAAGKSCDPAKYLRGFGIAAFIASALAGGICAARTGEGNFFAAPLAFAGIYILICYIASLALGGISGGALSAALTYLGAVFASFVGAFIGRRRKARKPKSLKKYKKYAKV